MKFSEYYQDKRVVSQYDQKRSKGLKSEIVRILEKKAIERLLPSKVENILEAGVGTGFITEPLRKYGKVSGVVSGFDVSQAMLVKTKAKFPKMKLWKDDLLNLKLKRKYDVVVSVRVISHFNPKDSERALKNLRKITKKKGIIIFNLENPSIIRKIARKIIKWGSTKTYQYSKKEIKKLMENSGLKIKEVCYIDHLYLLPLHIINKLFFDFLKNMVIKIELKLLKLRFASNNVFIKCQK